MNPLRTARLYVELRERVIMNGILVSCFLCFNFPWDHQLPQYSIG